MDNETNFRNINSPGSKVCSNEQTVGAVTEFYKGSFPVFLLHSAIKAAMGYFFLFQKITHFLYSILQITKDDPRLISCL